MILYLFLITGFVLLIKGADFLIKGASSLARNLNISDFTIGLTVVAFGTSAPELFVNIIASVNDNTGLVIGNVIGSNIANILLILGSASIIYPLTVSKGTVWKDIPFSLLAAILLGVLANDHFIDGKNFSELSKIDGIVFLSFFIIFMYYSFSTAKKTEGQEEHTLKIYDKTNKSVLLFLIGLAGLVLGSKLIVNNAVKLADLYEIDQSFVGLSVVALGTSLPELATSVVAAYRKNIEIAVGNIVGSNIFNIFLILGVSAIITPLKLNPNTNIDIGMTIFASLILFLTMFVSGKRRIVRSEGIIMVIFYFSYIVFAFFYSK